MHFHIAGKLLIMTFNENCKCIVFCDKIIVHTVDHTALRII